MTDLAPNLSTSATPQVGGPTPAPPAANANITPSGAMTQQVIDRIRNEYPGFFYLLGLPEVRDLLVAAVDPNTPFSPQEFAAKLQATNWYRTTQQSSREWDALFNQDPAGAAGQVRSRVAEIRDIAGNAGIRLDDRQLLMFAEQTLRYGVSTSSSEFRDSLALLIPDFRSTTGDRALTPPGGEFGLMFAQIKQMARDYLMPLSDRDAWAMAEQAFAGDLNIEGLAAVWGQRAAARNPSLAAAIESGLTPAQFFAPHRAAVANELGISADQIDLLDPKWSQILGVDDGKNGTRPMTEWEAQKFARNLPEWDNTLTANEATGELSRALLVEMGEIR